MSRCWLLIILLGFISITNATYEDARCKCVCVDHSVPKHKNGSTAEPKRSVFVKSIPSEKCTCPIMLEDKSDLCPYCDCKYQVRNTATIKVVVIMIVVILSALSLYLVFMLILDPFLATRGVKGIFPNAGQPNPQSASKTIRTLRSFTAASPKVGEYSDLNNNGLGEGEPTTSRPSIGGNAVVNRAREQQSRWKGQVEAQRERVFNERTILN